VKESRAGKDQVIRTPHEAAVARYWDEKQNDAINLLLGRDDGLIHHHYGVGEFDRSILQLPAESREEPLLAELHRMENRQTEMIINSLGGVGRNGRVLDAGSGRGGTAFMLHDRFGCFVEGITISTYQVEFSQRLAEQRGCSSRVKFHFQNMLRTDFPDDTFDRVVTNETTMYVDLFELYREFARVIKPGGHYVFITCCLNETASSASLDIQEIDQHYGCNTHPRSRYFKALVSNDLIPYKVSDLTAQAVPYWELRTQSAHRTGIEDAFLRAYLTRAANFLLVGTQYLPSSIRHVGAAR
jgi:geranyl diphosphate 2-C-methyltransferase